MEGPSLKLTILKGPRRGKTLEYGPGSVVSIGRAGGNTLDLKNSGISMKHLSIEFSRGKWLVKDLDSSNGTFVNEIQLASFTLCTLHDGDCLKFGETTSILVNIIHSPNTVHGNGPSLRKNTGRRAAAKVGKSIPEDDGFAQNQVGGVLQTRDSKENMASHANGSLGLEMKQGDPEELKNQAVAIPKKACLRGRRKKVVDVNVVSEEEKGLPVTTRQTRSSKNQHIPIKKVPESSNFIEDVGNGSENLAPPVGGCISPASKDGLEMENSKGKSTQDVNMSDLNVEDAPKENCGPKTCPESAGTSGIPTPDLYSMTMGDWFDYLEVALPQQIVGETEAMIEVMKKRAVQLAEYAERNKAENEKISMV